MPRRSPVDNRVQSKIDSHYKVFPKTDRKQKRYRLTKRLVTVPGSNSDSVSIEQTARPTTEDAILTEFDHMIQFGPCLGITRLYRWDRARGLGLNPPERVLDILLDDKGEERAKHRWSGLEYLFGHLSTSKRPEFDH
ncbi:hypothetical protein PQX77_015707 [Marasmius sp. AFHP31]|nr:hypothetical protein PQX77_015707 [Marasmius sp. AFHP31]